MNKEGIYKGPRRRPDSAIDLELMRPSPPWGVAVGQRYRVEARCLRTGDGAVKVTGTVKWVHPQKRFALLEYQGRAGIQRECYYPMELTQENRVS